MFPKGPGNGPGESERFLCCHHRDLLIFLITVQYELQEGVNRVLPTVSARQGETNSNLTGEVYRGY